MAVIFDPKNKNKDQDQNLQFNAPTGGATSAPVSPGSPTTGTSSGRFTNIQNYIKANRDAGQGLAQNIGGQLEQKGQGIRQELGQSQQQFQDQAEKGRLDRTKVVPEAGNIIGRAGQGGFESDVDRFKRLSSGQYTGPQEMQNAANLQGRGQEVEALGKNLGTSAGRTQVLGQLYGGQGGYTAGQRRLDDLLISQNTNSLQRARGLASGLGRTVQQQADSARGLAGYFGQEAAEVGSEVSKQLADTAQGDEAALGAKQQTAFTEEQKKIEQLKKSAAALGSGQITQDMIDKFGLSDLQGQGFDPKGTGFWAGFEGNAYNPYRQSQNIGKNEINTYGFNPNSLFSVHDASGQITRENIASKAEASRLNALSKLAGRGDVIDESQAETFKGSDVELNPEFRAQREAAQQNIRNLISEAHGLGSEFINQGVSQRYKPKVDRFYNIVDQVAALLNSKLTVT